MARHGARPFGNSQSWSPALPTRICRSRSIAAAEFPEARVTVQDGDRRDDCEMIYGFSLQHERRPFDRPPSLLLHIPMND